MYVYSGTEALRHLDRRQKNRSNAMTINSITPAMVPPTIAPTFGVVRGAVEPPDELAEPVDEVDDDVPVEDEADVAVVAL